MSPRLRVVAPFCLLGLLGLALLLDTADSARCDDCPGTEASAPNQPCTPGQLCSKFNGQGQASCEAGWEETDIQNVAVCVKGDFSYTRCVVSLPSDYCYTKYSCIYIQVTGKCIKGTSLGRKNTNHYVTEDC